MIRLIILCGAVAALSGCTKLEESEDGADGILSAMLGNPEAMPATLAETNLFAGGNPTQPAAALVHYNVKVPLWSDGAHKTRYILVPPGHELKHQPDSGAFEFPVGSVLVKHFAADPAGLIPVETRIMVLNNDGRWLFGTYLHDDMGSATLNVRPRTVRKADADFRIPSEKECQMCHSESKPVLGFSSRQLNRSLADGQNQFLQLAQRIKFVEPATNLAEQTAYDDPDDLSLPVNVRLRSYMAVNCSSCHHPQGPEKANRLDLRFEAEDNHLVSEGKIVPGQPEQSRLWQAITADSVDRRMPPLILRPDNTAQLLFRTYIEQALAPSP